MSDYKNLRNSPNLLKIYQNIIKDSKVKDDLTFNASESYHLGVLLVNDEHKKNYGYKNEKFIEMLDSIFSKVNYETFLEAISDTLNDNYDQANFNEFAGKLLISKNGVKYFYWLDFNKLILSYQDIFRFAPYVNIIEILKKKDIYPYFLPEGKKITSLVNLYQDFISEGCINTDDRVFNWTIDFMNSFDNDFKINKEIFKEFFIPELISKFTLNYGNNEKYILKRIKKLNELTDLKKYYNKLISNNCRYKISWRFFKIITENYYDKTIENLELKNNVILDLILDKDYSEKLKFFKKTFEKKHFEQIINQKIILRVQEIFYLNFDSQYLYPVFEEILDKYFSGHLGILIQGFTYLMIEHYKNYQKKLDYSSLVFISQIIKIFKLVFKKQPSHLKFFENYLSINFDNRYIKMFFIIFGKYFDSKDKILIKLNLLSYHLKLLINKKYLKNRKPIIEKYQNVLNQLITYEPNPKIKVLNSGCIHYQLLNSSFTKSEHPIIKVPSSFNFKNLVRGYYLEKYQLYLIADIYLDNYTFNERIEIIRKFHPLTKKNFSIPIITNKNNKINQEQLFQSLSQNNIKWYPHLYYYFLDEETKKVKLISDTISLKNIF
jgi:hypothetical protein